jgi:ubiquinol-cytochrome c reductase iron-sulfur subunit
MASTDARRLYYRAALKLLALALALFVLQAMVSGFFSHPETDTALPVAIPLDGFEPGEIRLVQWAGQELLVLRRSRAMDAADIAHEARLYDPSSRLSVQPRGARNPGRTLVPGYFIAYARGTDLSCPLDLVSPETAAGQGWGGGFVDRCRGSRYDFAGRVYDGQPARRNLEVPAYRVEGTGIVLGD